MISIISKEWCETMAKLEADAEVAAGLIAFDPIFDGMPMSDGDSHDEARMAFSRFINMARRGRGLSIETLAKEADIDIGELMSIEEDPHYETEPRTIYQLAQILQVSEFRLMELSGLVKAKDAGFIEEAVRYAASSKSVEELTPEEQMAYDGLISVLSEK